MNSDWLPTDPVPHDLTAEQCFRAVRTVARHATDAAELVCLLDMLGLTAEQGRTEPAAPEPTEARAATPHTADLQRLANPFLPITNSRIHRRRPRVTAVS